MPVSLRPRCRRRRRTQCRRRRLRPPPRPSSSCSPRPTASTWHHRWRRRSRPRPTRQRRVAAIAPTEGPRLCLTSGPEVLTVTMWRPRACDQRDGGNILLRQCLIGRAGVRRCLGRVTRIWTQPRVVELDRPRRTGMSPRVTHSPPTVRTVGAATVCGRTSVRGFTIHLVSELAT